MKKVVKLVGFFILCFVVLELIFVIFKTKHNIEYKLNIGDKTYDINEVFKDKKYYVTISLDNIKYSYVFDNIFHKSKKIIKDIKYYVKDDLKCIYPVLDNGYIVCSKDNKLYSGNYFINDLGDFSSYLDASYSTKTRNIGFAKVYYENIKDNYIYVYKYNGMYSIGEKLEDINMFSNDTYNNELGVLIGKYYVSFNYDDKYEYNTILIYNITNNKKRTIELEKPISKSSYINGVVDNKLYVFDVDNLVQYEINPKNKKVREVGNKKDGVMYYDGEFKTLDVYDFKKEVVKFKYNDVSYSYYNKIGNISYYLDDDNNFVMHNDVTLLDVVLFNKRISNINISDDFIYFVNDNTVYSYYIGGTFVPLVSYDELRFNPLNRVFVYKK